MIEFIAALLVGVFLGLAALHLYWAGGGTRLKWGAVPPVDGQPAFVPARLLTQAVALALIICALLVAGTAGWLPMPIPRRFFCGLMGLLALVFLARAIGDRRLVGFFKTQRDSDFARLDSWLYSPLCLLIALGLLQVALARY